MNPTNKLVSDLVAFVLGAQNSVRNAAEFLTRVSCSMEATYINTGHPDFISGHKAMAIVNNRMEANKPQQSQQIDPRTGKLPPGAVNNNKDLDVEVKQKEEGFFGSFWQNKGGQNAAAKKRMSMMEAVRVFLVFSLLCRLRLTPALPTATTISQSSGSAF